MPKCDIDYSNTIIYKITCIDPKVTDVYVGHTTNFVQRKYSHKQTCITPKSSAYNCKLYKVIRENGGWINWKMEIVGFFNCQDHYEARQKEQEYFEILHANLNSIEPLPKQNTHSNILYKQKHIQDAGCNKIGSCFFCETCKYNTSRKSSFKKHLTTDKHKNSLFKTENYECKCGKTYKYSQGLSKHKKVCYENKSIPESSIFINNTILNLIKQNQDLQNKVIEQNKENMELQKKIIECVQKREPEEINKIISIVSSNVVINKET
jgi:GIY-YIG catalytic domain